MVCSRLRNGSASNTKKKVKVVLGIPKLRQHFPALYQWGNVRVVWHLWDIYLVNVRCKCFPRRTWRQATRDHPYSSSTCYLGRTYFLINRHMLPVRSPIPAYYIFIIHRNKFTVTASAWTSLIWGLGLVCMRWAFPHKDKFSDAINKLMQNQIEVLEHVPHPHRNIREMSEK